jgi:hypothetical protein
MILRYALTILLFMIIACPLTKAQDILEFQHYQLKRHNLSCYSTVKTDSTIITQYDFFNDNGDTLLLLHYIRYSRRSDTTVIIDQKLSNPDVEMKDSCYYDIVLKRNAKNYYDEHTSEYRRTSFIFKASDGQCYRSSASNALNLLSIAPSHQQTSSKND